MPWGHFTAVWGENVGYRRKLRQKCKGKKNTAMVPAKWDGKVKNEKLLRGKD